MRKSRRTRILTKLGRQPHFTYIVTPILGTDYTSVRVVKVNARRNSEARYNNANLPEWMKVGMQMLDLTYDSTSEFGRIPGFGQICRGEYAFYQNISNT